MVASVRAEGRPRDTTVWLGAGERSRGLAGLSLFLNLELNELVLLLSGVLVLPTVESEEVVDWVTAEEGVKRVMGLFTLGGLVTLDLKDGLNLEVDLVVDLVLVSTAGAAGSISFSSAVLSVLA